MRFFGPILAFFTCVVSIFAYDGHNAVANCNYSLVESIPENVVLNQTGLSQPTADVILAMFKNAKRSIQIASFYWTLLCSDVVTDPSCQAGENVLAALKYALEAGKVKVQIAVNYQDKSFNQDLDMLTRLGAAVRHVNVSKFMGAGILHTKFVIVDDTQFYVGSSNMDWRSYTQVKELGIHVTNCESLANDLQKVFSVYWYLGREGSQIPKNWPQELETKINAKNPLKVKMASASEAIFMSSSPKPFNPLGRTNDIDAVIHVIRSANKSINIAVMDYVPALIYVKPEQYWPIIDDELRRAVVERNVQVRMLISHWKHTRRDMFTFLKSLNVFRKFRRDSALRVKLFTVPELPSNRTEIPYSRVNHNKYMVTDRHAYIGTSNWSGDYFTDTAGVAFVATPTSPDGPESIRQRLSAIFDRDWNSEYSRNLYSEL